VIDANGIPLTVGLSAANTHDSQLLEPLVDAVPAVIGPRGRPGRPRRRPASRMLTRAMTIRSAGGSCAIEGSARESPGVAWSPASGWGVIAGRWGFLARLLTNRRLTVRYERHADIVTVLLHLACALICARKLQPLCTTATSPSALRHPPTPGRFRLEPSRAALPRRHPAPA
jgi:hypothetical protein